MVDDTDIKPIQPACNPSKYILYQVDEHSDEETISQASSRGASE